MKARIFIGSASETLDIAHALQANLTPDFDCTVWNQGKFGLSNLTLESLISALRNTDFSVFILGADDEVRMRGTVAPVARDNVIFELGLSIGIVGRFRTFLVIPSGINLHLPTDLLGVVATRYQLDRADGNIYAAVGVASFDIRSAVRHNS